MQAQQNRNSAVVSILGFLGLAFFDVLMFMVSGKGIPCLFRLWTGYLCPGCGMTRAAAALVSGDVGSAWQFNPLILTVVPVLGAYLFHRFVRSVRGKFEGFRIWELILLVVILLVVIGFGVKRNMVV